MKKIILAGITGGGRTLREELEVINYRETILYVEKVAANKKSLKKWE